MGTATLNTQWCVRNQLTCSQGTTLRVIPITRRGGDHCYYREFTGGEYSSQSGGRSMAPQSPRIHLKYICIWTMRCRALSRSLHHHPSAAADHFRTIQPTCRCSTNQPVQSNQPSSAVKRSPRFIPLKTVLSQGLGSAHYNTHHALYTPFVLCTSPISHPPSLPFSNPSTINS